MIAIGCWSAHYRASLVGVRVLRRRLRRLLAKLRQEPYSLPISSEQQERLLLLQTELMTNCVKHASPKASKLSFRCWQIGSHWWLTLQDDGGYFDPWGLPSPIKNIDRFESGGYGIGLLHHLSFELKVRRHPQINGYLTCNR